MRSSAFALATLVGLTAAAGGPLPASAQNAQDFVFTDEDGHLVLRFTTEARGSLDASDVEEVVNVQLSTMVHDRLRADAMFEAEPVDSEWARSMEARIERHFRATAPDFHGVEAECRSASCRLVLDHASTWRVSEHESLMDVAQDAIRAFIEANPASLEPDFLIAAHYQEPDTPYMKVFVRRAGDGKRARRRSDR